MHVLVVHFKKEQLLSALLPPALRAKLLWAEWGPVPRQMLHGPARWAYLAAARRADLILAVSAGTRDSVCALGVPPEHVHVIPNAVPGAGVLLQRDRPGAGTPGAWDPTRCASRRLRVPLSR